MNLSTGFCWGTALLIGLTIYLFFYRLKPLLPSAALALLSQQPLEVVDQKIDELDGEVANFTGFLNPIVSVMYWRIDSNPFQIRERLLIHSKRFHILRIDFYQDRLTGWRSGLKNSGIYVENDAQDAQRAMDIHRLVTEKLGGELLTNGS